MEILNCIFTSLVIDHCLFCAFLCVKRKLGVWPVILHTVNVTFFRCFFFARDKISKPGFMKPKVVLEKLHYPHHSLGPAILTSTPFYCPRHSIVAILMSLPFHLFSGIICGSGIICNPIWGSFAVGDHLWLRTPTPRV